jgi:hypothetical protein
MAATTTQLHGMAVGVPHIEMFPDGHILVCGARCSRFLDGSAERNAQVFDQNGTLAWEMTLGDGIEHIQVDDSGALWVGYSDEGIFGNYGWGMEPIGAAGIIRFDRQGQKQWEWPAHWHSIFDDYALNVCDASAWAYTYDQFSLDQIDICNPTNTPYSWRTDIHGASAVAVSGSLVAIFGGYGEDRMRCVLGQMIQGVIEDQRQVELVTEQGVALPNLDDFHRVIGRASQLHFFVGDAWYSLNLDTLSVS